MRTAGLVLAAGAASRFGSTKQLAVVGGRPMVAHAVETALAAGLSPVVVVVGHDADEVADAVPDGADVVVNEEHAKGQSTSLRAGLAALDGAADVTGVVVLLADEPNVRADAVEQVAKSLERGDELVRCVYRDRPGHPVGIARSRWDDAVRSDGRDAGAVELLRGPGTVLLTMTGRAPVDVDRPEDLPDR